MITIQLSFDSSFKEKIKKNKNNKDFIVQLYKSESLREVIIRFIPKKELSHIGLIIVNKKFKNLDYNVVDGDKINILPLLFGG